MTTTTISTWGQAYGCDPEPAYVTPDGPVWMHRKGQRVRFFDDHGIQVGDEHRNVAPAIVFAAFQGWIDPTDPMTSAILNAGIRAQAV